MRSEVNHHARRKDSRASGQGVRTMTTRTLAPLLLLAITACNGDRGIVGTYEDTEGGSSSGSAGSSESGPACGDACDPDFAVAHLSGVNLASKTVHLLGDTTGTCEGERCPTTLASLLYEGAAVGPCIESEDALDSLYGPDEYCRLSPLVTAYGLEVGFATPVDRSSFVEVGGGLETADAGAYLWRAGIVTIEGPGTAYRGAMPVSSAGTPQTITDVRNLTCIDRLAAEGIAWTPATLDALCSATWDDGGTLRPRRMAATMEHVPTHPRYGAGGVSCDTPDGSDTCCSSCDYELSVAIAKYGVDELGQRRDPAQGTAIACDPDGDVLVECRGLVTSVDRSRETNSYTYAWDGAAQAWPLPRGDKLRETHPDDRPAGLEAAGASCETNGECEAGLDCLAGTCRVPWVGRCVASPATTGTTGYCVDARFDDDAAGACFVATADFEHGAAGDRLVSCDVEDNGLQASECCDPALGGGEACDPFFQSGIAPIARYDRRAALPDKARCTCDEASAEAVECAAAVATWCAAPLGDPDPDLLASPPGAWAVRTVEARGGVRWDDEVGVLDLRLADFGGQPRASAEACAESRLLVPAREAADAWNASFAPERIADHDVAMCSGSTYRVRFATSEAPAHVRSELGGTLDGRDVHVIETSQFRIVPGSAFPTEELRIGACDDFSVRFTNRFDISASNLGKLELRDDADVVVAGGPGCSATATPEEIAAGAVPCLTIDLGNHGFGEISVGIDDEVHGVVLQVGQRYRLVAPGLVSIAQLSDATAYAASFHDACGMPLVYGEGAELQALSEAAFTIDEGCE